MKINWKAIAIFYTVIFLVLLAAWIVGTVSYNQEEEKTNICYYDVCEIYPEADYTDDVCTCYDYDVLGDYIVSKQEYMK